ncbi:MAG: N-6 DNA methylase, partial [Lachnospiraceae bacterium]|nr:N-6 DNA methylase [Lachnospiraceae bacterium]
MEQIYKLENAFASDLRGKTDKPYQASISIAYLLVALKNTAIKDVDWMSVPQMCEAIRDEEIRWYVQENLSGVEPDLILQYYKYDTEMLKEYVLFADDRSSNRALEVSSPDSISRLAISILDIQDGETVLDSCAGVGSFLVRAYHNQPRARYSGVEMNSGAACLLKMRSNLLEGEV